MPLPALNDYSAVQAYFTAKEWAEISDYEKLRLKNIKENYEMMIEVGLQVSPPEFMRPRRGRKKQIVEESDSEDEEWKPTRAKKKSRGSFSTPFKPPSKTSKPAIMKKQPVSKPHTVTSGTVYDEDGHPLNDADHIGGERIIDLLEWKDFDESAQVAQPPASTSSSSCYQGNQSGDQTSQSGDQKTKQNLTEVSSGGDHTPKQSLSSCMKVGGHAGGKAKSISGMRKSKAKPSPRQSRYPRRAVTRKCYKEDDVPDDDHYIYCEDCHEIFEGECSKHPLTIIKDNPIPKGSQDRARQTLPDGLMVKQSSIPGAGLGVFATKFIPKGYRFGPYDGDIVDLETGYDSGYAWEICTEGKPHHYVDSNSEQTGNWMRYINCARNESEQNLVAFQYLGEIYYRTFKPICPGRELLVYYGEQYAKDLGINSQLNKLNVETDSGLYRCEYCGSLYAIPLVLARHLKWKHGHIGIVPQPGASKETILQFIKGEIQKPTNQSHINSGCRVSLENAVRNNEKTAFHSNVSNKKCKDSTSKSQGVCTQRGGEIIPENNSTACESTQTSKKPYICNDFGKEYNFSNDLAQHKENRVSKCICNHCGKRYFDLSALRKHKRIHTGEKPYVCDQCGKAFNQSGTLANHKRIHRGDQCGKAFNRVYSLTTHKRIHSGEKPHVCDHCGKAFNHEPNLKRHKRIHTGEKPYVCDQCGKAFNQEAHLTTHKRIHTGEKPYVCDQCGKAFAYEHHLRRHKRIHTGEKPYVCDQCGKAFTNVHDLKRHKRIHTGEKPYTCDQCGKAFNRENNLTTHKRTHTGEKPYVCDQCGKAFNHEPHLTTHKRIHTGKKPYVCDQCGKAFNQEAHLTTHKRIHTGEKPYVCDQCGKTWSRSSSLMYHKPQCSGPNTRCNEKLDQSPSISINKNEL